MGNLIERGGLGTNSIGRGTWSGNSIPASYTYALHRNPFVYTGSLQGLELTSATSESQHRYAAWTDLQVQDVTVHPSPVPPESQIIEMVARRSVHLQPGFLAEAGSAVHLHLEETFPDCVDESFQYPTMAPGPPAPEHQLKSTPAAAKLELRFQAAGKPRIFPNPAQTALWVELPTDAPAFLELYDGLGRLAGRWSASGQSTMIDVARLAPGPYRLRIVQRGTETSHTFIKQP